MGLNAYFTYQVVGFHGSGTVPYRLALTAVFVEGLIFVFLALTGMRQWLVRMVPSSLKIAATSGIGLFLALIGLSTSGGVGLITGSANHPTDLGGCTAEYMDDFGACTSHKMLNPTVSSSSFPCFRGCLTHRHHPGLDWYLLWRFCQRSVDDVQGMLRVCSIKRLRN